MTGRTTSQAEGERVDDRTGLEEDHGHPDVPQTTPSQAEGERTDEPARPPDRARADRNGANRHAAD